jgi:hypothetical protein
VSLLASGFMEQTVSVISSDSATKTMSSLGLKSVTAQIRQDL